MEKPVIYQGEVIGTASGVHTEDGENVVHIRVDDEKLVKLIQNAAIKSVSISEDGMFPIEVKDN